MSCAGGEGNGECDSLHDLSRSKLDYWGANPPTLVQRIIWGGKNLQAVPDPLPVLRALSVPSRNCWGTSRDGDPIPELPSHGEILLQVHNELLHLQKKSRFELVAGPAASGDSPPFLFQGLQKS